MQAIVPLLDKNTSRGPLVLNAIAFACGVVSLAVGLSAVSSQSKLEKLEKELRESSDSQTVPSAYVEESEKSHHDRVKTSPGASLNSFIWFMIFFSITLGLVAVFYPPYIEPTYRSLDVQTVKEEFPTFATEISELVKFNNIPGDSKITSFVGESLAQSKVINSETQQSYLLDLPRVTSIKDGSANYISVTGTVDDYTLTFSNPDLDIAATYTSKTGVTTLNDD